MCLSRYAATLPGSVGGRHQIEAGDTVWTIAAELSQLGTKVTPYDLLKYNSHIDPEWLKTGSVLVVPTPPAGMCVLWAYALRLTNKITCQYYL